MNPEAIVLATRVRAELADLEIIIERAQRLLAKAAQDEDYLDGVALNLHSFYTGAERILEDIAREIDGVIPTGPDWHRNLLIQMSAEVKTIRPLVIQHDTRLCLDNYRGFRHVVRNVYTFNLKPTRLKELVDGLADCYEDLSNNIQQFCDFLEASTESDSSR
ncbi:hypothetical protein PN498_03800 [Oscillatoria sp. CS-180]|uniref:ribonuclease toxin HepT-like protein n=1 Tax=Oscillatoria sp. CS-180 TaxID=3021720 RepID=UPI0023300F38|nr:hypothetical protein [Oscillatoria sp. CS-180]MDB9525099.1 hypothetical protein [Oscillatoria sp. CS-180]